MSEKTLTLEEVKKIPPKFLLKIINILKKRVKNHPVLREAFKEHGADIEEIEFIPIAFGDLDVSARTDHGIIILNYGLIQDGIMDDDHYLVHEITHWLQQTTGDSPTKGSNGDDYLDNEFEQESFQNQTKYMADTKGEDEAKEYIDRVLDRHDIPDGEREDKKDKLLAI